MVEAMVGYGIPEVDNCNSVRHRAQVSSEAFPDRARHGPIKAHAKVAGNLYRIATGNGREAVTAADLLAEG